MVDFDIESSKGSDLYQKEDQKEFFIKLLTLMLRMIAVALVLAFGFLI